LGVVPANEVMDMAAIAYNIKKYLKFTQKKTNTAVRVAVQLFFSKLTLQTQINPI
jgi:hypothetical protein